MRKRAGLGGFISDLLAKSRGKRYNRLWKRQTTAKGEIMATDPNYVEYVLERLQTSLPVTCKKMFGEYQIYVDGKPALLVCDNTVFVKKLPEFAEIMAGADSGYPYDGAKEHYVLDVENEDLTARVIDTLVAVTPAPKKKKR